MLELRKRHQEGCPLFTPARPFSKNLGCKRCVYVAFGTVKGKKIRKSLDTTNRDEAGDALEQVRRVVRGDAPMVITITLEESSEKYLAELQNSGRKPKTVRRYRSTLKYMIDFLTSRGAKESKDVTTDLLGDFKAIWPERLTTDVSRQKEQERVRAFFRWCKKRRFIAEDPAEGLMKIKTPKGSTRERFTEAEIKRISKAVDEVYPASVKGRFREKYKTRRFVRAFLLVLRYTALRIGDVTNLQKSHLHGDRLFLRTLKGRHDHPVYTVVPPVVTTALKSIENEGEFFFYPGNPAALESWQKHWSEILKPVYRRAGTKFTSHAWRDTLVFKLLSKGVSIEIISRLLGHENIQITWDHYSAWVPELQEQLESVVRQHIHTC